MRLAWVRWASAGCGPIPVGSECPLELTELMSSGESWALPGTDLRTDFVELRNGGEQPVDLDTYGLSLQVPGRDDPVKDFLSAAPISLAPGERIFGVASTYEVRDLSTVVLGGGARFTVVLDMNNDNASVELRRRDLEDRICEHVFVPDQHVELSFSRQDDSSDPWCIAEPTPGEDNAPCFAELDGASIWSR